MAQLLMHDEILCPTCGAPLKSGLPVCINGHTISAYEEATLRETNQMVQYLSMKSLTYRPHKQERNSNEVSR